MGIIDAIKQTAGNVARGAARLVTGKQKQATNTHTEYRQVKQDGDVTITTVSDQPIKKPFSETVANKVEQHNNLAKSVIGEDNSEEHQRNSWGYDHSNKDNSKQSSDIPYERTPQTPKYTPNRREMGARLSKQYGGKKVGVQQGNNTSGGFINTAKSFINRAKFDPEKKTQFRNKEGATGTVIRQAQRIPKVAVKKAREGAAWVKKQNPALVEKLQKPNVSQQVAWGGNMFITAFTGKNPQKQYAKIQKRKDKETKLGKKISKKEAKALAKKYGKNWRMAVKQNTSGQYFANPNQQEFQKIKRQNMLESKSIDFGGAFPEPSMTIGSARQPFVARNIDPTDIDANFMGDRGSGFSVKKDPFSFGDSGLLIRKQAKSKDPFAISGFKL